MLALVFIVCIPEEIASLLLNLHSFQQHGINSCSFKDRVPSRNIYILNFFIPNIIHKMLF